MPIVDEFQTDEILFDKFTYVDKGGTHPQESWKKGEHVFFYPAQSPALDIRRQRLVEQFKDDPLGDTYALILSLAHHTSITLSPTFQAPVLDDQGNITYGEDGLPITTMHPLAGKRMPMTLEYLQKFSNSEIRAMAEFCLGIIKIRDPEMEAEFRRLAGQVVGPGSENGTGGSVDVPEDSLVPADHQADAVAERRN